MRYSAMGDAMTLRRLYDNLGASQLRTYFDGTELDVCAPGLSLSSRGSRGAALKRSASGPFVYSLDISPAPIWQKAISGGFSQNIYKIETHCAFGTRRPLTFFVERSFIAPICEWLLVSAAWRFVLTPAVKLLRTHSCRVDEFFVENPVNRSNGGIASIVGGWNDVEASIGKIAVWRPGRVAWSQEFGPVLLLRKVDDYVAGLLASGKREHFSSHALRSPRTTVDELVFGDELSQWPHLLNTSRRTRGRSRRPVQPKTPGAE